LRVFAYDVQSIHSFLFESLEFKAIAGASLLIDRFDEAMKKTASEQIKCLFAGGGTGLFVVRGENSKLRKLFEEKKKEYLYDHPVACVEFEFDDRSINTDDYPIWFRCKGLKESGDFPKIYSRVALELEKEKQRIAENLTQERVLSHPCPLCGNREKDSSYPYNDDYICNACYLKIRESSQIEDRKVTFNLDLISKRGKETRKSEEKTEEGYIGVVYGDGNSLGNVYQKMNTSEEFSTFSLQLRKHLQSAIEESAKIVDHYAVPLRGGDDFLMILPPAQIIQVLEILERQLEPLRTEKSITFSFGLAVLPKTVPLKFIFQIVEALQDEAKHERSQYSRETNEHYAAFRFIDKPFFGEVRDKKKKLQYGAGMTTRELFAIHQKVQGLMAQKVTKGVMSKLQQIFVESENRAFTLNSFYFLSRNTEIPKTKIRDFVTDEISKQRFGTLEDVFLFQESFGEGESDG